MVVKFFKFAIIQRFQSLPQKLRILISINLMKKFVNICFKN